MSSPGRVGKPLWRDIRDFAPDYVDAQVSGVSGEDLVNNRMDSANIYHHINFMMHLLWGVPYHAEDEEEVSVHGRVDLLAQAMLVNLNPPAGLPSNDPRRTGWPSQLGAAARIIPDHLNGIRELDSVQDGITVKQLFVEDARGDDIADDRYEIITRCFQMQDDLMVAGLDICLPFLTIQGRPADDRPLPPNDKNGNPDRRLARESTFNAHSPNLKKTNGDYLTLKDLFVHDQCDFDRNTLTAVGAFRNDGIFRPRSQNVGSPIAMSSHEGEVGPMTGGQGNNYKCMGANGCQKEDEYYCSYDSEGQCSGMSGG